jgi:hypothetical protein
MNHKWLILGFLFAALMAVARAEDKPRLPEGPPPRLATVVEVKGDVVVYRDFYFAPPVPKKAGPLTLTELVPSHPSSGPWFTCAVEFPLKEGQVCDAAGKKLDAGAARKRLAAGDTVLVSLAGKEVDPAYLRVVKKETLVLIHPPSPLGPPLPKRVPKDDK